jgi:hypothetical protein
MIAFSQVALLQGLRQQIGYHPFQSSWTLYFVIWIFGASAGRSRGLQKIGSARRPVPLVFNPSKHSALLKSESTLVCLFNNYLELP